METSTGGSGLISMLSVPPRLGVASCAYASGDRPADASATPDETRKSRRLKPAMSCRSYLFVVRRRPVMRRSEHDKTAARASERTVTHKKSMTLRKACDAVSDNESQR